MKQVAIASILVAGLALSACHTVNGVGKDVKSAGSTLSKASGEEPKRK